MAIFRGFSGDMKRTPFRLRLCVCLLIVNLIFIWGNSVLPAEASSAFSDWVRDLLAGLSHSGAAGEGDTGLLRKLAHFSEFACLGILLGWLGGMLKKRRLLPLCWGFAAGCVDECIQIFSPGRSSSPVDVMIDTAGVLVGICLIRAGYGILRKNPEEEGM